MSDEHAQTGSEPTNRRALLKGGLTAAAALGMTALVPKVASATCGTSTTLICEANTLAQIRAGTGGANALNAIATSIAADSISDATVLTLAKMYAKVMYLRTVPSGPLPDPGTDYHY